MNNCYYFKLYNFNDGLLNNFVDATYIIHLVNNGRIDDIKKKIYNTHTTNILYIVYNKGYKKCTKDKYVISSVQDIIDVNFEIFKHAKINNYNNILVLEDDYIFSDEIKNKNNINIIEKFIKNKINFQYYLGCLPILMVPIDFYNYKLVLGTCSHSVIYSKANREIILKTSYNTIYEWDTYNIKIHQCYTFYKPLCYQLFPATENQQNWGKYAKHTKIYNPTKLGLKILNLLKLDTTPEPGYTIIYFTAKLPYLIFIIFIVWLVLKFIS